MPRPQKPRWIQENPVSFCFLPAALDEIPMNAVVLTLDELEALRLADMEGMSQEEGAELMGISRATFGRIAASARRKTAAALVAGQPIAIEGGVVMTRPGAGQRRGRGRGRGGPWRGGRQW